MRWLSALIMLPFALAAGQAAAAGTSPSVSGIEPGQWELRSREPGEAALRLCIRDVQSLVQIRHQGQSCRRFVVEDRAERLSVTYECPSTGRGQTSIRAETPRLVQIDSQGIVDGNPFALNLEGRRVGTCSPLAKK